MGEPLVLLVPARQRQAFFSAPDALDPLMIDLAAFQAQMLGDFAVSLPSVLLGKLDRSKT